MYLKRLEIQGFKSFANKTALSFEPGITSIVGPNGSGKSNVADAVRWVLGEQSKSAIRSKKSEDVIFVGSDKKSRSSMASVSVIFDNSDKKLPIDSAEVMFTRRLHRDGTSEYLINNQDARLMDITEALSKAGFAQSKYTVIGQGVIDQFLLQGPAEIKAIIEEAAGLAPYYSKHDKTVRRLQSTRENLEQVTALIKEIEPRLKTLRRQAKKLEQRAHIENQWKELVSGRLAHVYLNLEKEQKEAKQKIKNIQKKIDSLESELQKFFDQVSQKDEQSSKRSGTISELQENIAEQQRKKEKMQMELTEVRIKISSHSKPRSEDIDSLRSKLDDYQKQHKEVSHQAENVAQNIQETETDINEIIDILNSAKPDLVPRFNQIVEKFINSQQKFLNTLKTQQDDLSQSINKIEKQIKEISSNDKGWKGPLVESEKNISQNLKKQEQKIKDLQSKLETELSGFSSYTSERQEADKEIRSREKELNKLKNEQGDLKVALARIEARLEEEGRRAREDLGPNFKEVLKKAKPITDEGIESQISNLKRQLEMIGGLDEMTMQEYEETEDRYTYFTSQVRDLEEAAEDLEHVLDELNNVIKTTFNKAFSVISKKFSEYFRLLFNGGKADLYLVKDEPKEGQEDEDIEEEKKALKVSGVGVKATPPGKKLSSIASLSGGERTLTSITLLIAMLDAYPSPFVVLDEVDAALDESNSIRFAKILGQLAHQTQFITITHNRETMRRAHTLYGVTMGDDDVSQMLSIKFNETAEYAKD